LTVLGIFSLFLSNLIIKNNTKNFIFDDVKNVPACKTAVVLGTSKTMNNSSINPYFLYRIQAASELYKSGKIQYVIVSGDNSIKGYNEPEQMKNDLIAEGIPENKIFEDFAGFRTLDSVVRAKEIFGQKKYIIISQKFHNERAVYLARENGIVAFGYNAQDVNKYFGFRTQLREYFARVKVFADLLLGIDPKFGGEKIEIK
jgi:SanA protein